jgi:hypothetical protein
LLLFLLVYAGVNLRQAFSRVLFYRGGLAILLPFRPLRYAYADLCGIHGYAYTRRRFARTDVPFALKRGWACQLRFADGLDLILDGSRYAGLEKNIEFWQSNLVRGNPGTMPLSSAAYNRNPVVR